MFDQSKFTLLLATLFWTSSSYGVNQQVKGKNAREMVEMMTYLFTPHKLFDEPKNLLLVEGYLRIFGPLDFIAEISKLIGNYTHTINYYPYTSVTFANSNSDSLTMMGSPFYTELTDTVYARAMEDYIYIANRERVLLLPNSTFLHDYKDRITRLVALKEVPGYFSFLVLSQAGLLSYFTFDQYFVEHKNICLHNFSDYGDIQDKIFVHLGDYYASFLVLLNLDTPILHFYQGLNKDIDKRAVGGRVFDTSEWYKSSQNSFKNFEFLGRDHFLILNHHPDLGNRLFFYYLHSERPVGYLSLNKKYTNLMRFSCDVPSLCFYSQHESHMLVFDYTQQGFIEVTLPSNLYPLIALLDTKQLIMGYINSQKKSSCHEYGSQKLFLCNIIGSQVIIQGKFLLKGVDKPRQVVKSWHHESTNGLLLFAREVKIVNADYEHLCYEQQAFKLVKQQKYVKSFQGNFSGIKFC